MWARPGALAHGQMKMKLPGGARDLLRFSATRCSSRRNVGQLPHGVRRFRIAMLASEPARRHSRSEDQGSISALIGEQIEHRLKKVRCNPGVGYIAEKARLALASRPTTSGH